MKYDAFISHAGEDKDVFVRPLAVGLKDLGLKIWYDEFELNIGDNLRASIDLGLSRSKFGIVVLSPDFFKKNWPKAELEGLIAREISGRKIILPVWYNVSKKDVLKFSPILANKVALNASRVALNDVIQKLAEFLRTN